MAPDKAALATTATCRKLNELASQTGLQQVPERFEFMRSSSRVPFEGSHSSHSSTVETGDRGIVFILLLF
jgi:hypothetical protein